MWSLQVCSDRDFLQWGFFFASYFEGSTLTTEIPDMCISKRIFSFTCVFSNSSRVYASPPISGYSQWMCHSSIALFCIPHRHPFSDPLGNLRHYHFPGQLHSMLKGPRRSFYVTSSLCTQSYFDLLNLSWLPLFWYFYWTFLSAFVKLYLIYRSHKSP